ncbi:MAG: glycosyltransferase [Ignavibacteriae bacterium]|nr:glycosyltransferase [Ignavibacteriota bacterium]
MKIIIVSPAYPWRGGIAHHTAILADHLKAKHTVEIVTFYRQYPKLFFPGTSQSDIGGCPPAVPVRMWIDTINPFNWISVGLKIRRMEPDLLLFAYSLPFFGPCYGTISALVRQTMKTRVMFICHNVVPHERRIGDVLFTKFAFAFSDYFIVQSSIVRDDLLKFVPNAKYSIAPHPLYEMFGLPLLKQDAKKRLNIIAGRVLLHFGYVRPYKGLMVLIEAMKQIRDLEPKNGDPLLLVVGEFYEDVSRYRRKVKELNLESCIRIVESYVPTDQVATYFSAADVVVLPYLSATQSGIVQIAYNFNKPVIATNVGGLTEVVVEEKTGFLVPPNSPEALAEAVKRFYLERREEEFSTNVRIEKKKYSWENLVRQIEELGQSSHRQF